MSKSYKKQAKLIKADDKRHVNREERKNVKRNIVEGRYEELTYHEKISKRYFDDEY